MKNLMLVFISCLLVSCGTDTGSQSAGTLSTTGDLAGFTLSDYPQGGVKKAVKKDNKSQITEEGDVVNGKRDGIWLKYNNTRNVGTITEIASYRNGQINGAVISFDDSGRLTGKTFFANGVPHGAQGKYKYGKSLLEANYVNGQLDGVYKTFYDDGKIQQESNYKNGKKHGKATYYNQEGKVTLEYNYNNGVKE